MSNRWISNENLVRLLGAIRKAGLPEAVEAEIVAKACDCVRMRLGQPDEYTTVGNSRFGGVPDLPEGIAWPRQGDKYLNFIVQVNLAELPAVSGDLLPRRGMLYFFVAEDEPAADISVRLLFFEGDPATLKKAEAPADEELLQEYYTGLKPYQLIAYEGLDLPDSEDVFALQELEEANPTEEKGQENGATKTWDEVYFALQEELSGEGAAIKIWGLPATIYGSDPREDAYLARSGRGEHIYDYAYQREHGEEIVAGAVAWRLLLTVASDAYVGITIWDAGFFEVLVRDTDLAERRFDAIYARVASS